MLRDFLNAVRFLTVFPLPSAKEHRAGDLARAMFFFPAAGLLIAACAYGLFLLFTPFFPSRVAVLILLIAPILISGGLHADGFADFCDGFFGGKDKESILRIMKDSRVGAWGALGMALLVLVKFELLQSAAYYVPVFFLAAAASRWSQVFLSAWLPYAGAGGGISEQVAGKAGRREILGATLFMAVPVVWFPWEGLAMIALLIMALLSFGLYVKKKLGGVTGDVLGAASELTEIFIYTASFMIARIR